MKRKLQRHFSLTDKGIDNMMRASRASFFKYVTFMFPPMLVFIFLNDMINSNLKPIAHYIGIIVIIAILMYLATAREYKLTYDVTYEESVNLRIEVCFTIVGLTNDMTTAASIAATMISLIKLFTKSLIVTTLPSRH